ncbi:MAG: DNA-binding protein, partial [Clostridia bacterium]|nr:DNA-binding protein [Clostridia bacterium]
ADKRLLTMETIIGVMCVVVFFVLTIVAAYIDVKEWIRVMLIFIGLIPLLVAVPVLLKIEQVAGYYECKNCGHKYIPTYKAVNMAPHMGRTRYMKCPKCGEKTWQRKVINKD